MANRRSDSCDKIICFSVVCSAVLTSVSSQDCSAQRYNACFDAFNAGDPSNAVVPWYSKAVLVGICTNLQTLTNCMQNVFPFCSGTTQVIYQGVVSGYTFLCNDGYDEYLTYQQCFADTGVQREGKSCITTYNKLVDDALNNTNVDIAYKRDRLCQYSNTYVDCISNALQSFCSGGAATWQKTFDTKQLCPLLSGLKCNGWTTKCLASSSTTISPQVSTSSGLTTTTLIVLICLISFAFVLIVGSVVIILVVRVRPRKNRTVSAPVTDMDPNLFGDRIELPPPYPYPGAFGRQAVVRSPTAEPTPIFMTTSRPNNSIPAATIDEAMLDADVRGQDTAPSNNRRIAADGHFVPETMDADDLFDVAILPSLPNNRSYGLYDNYGLHDNSGFIPDNESVTDYEQIGAAASFSAPSTSPSTVFTLQSPFRLHNPPHHHRHQHLHQNGRRRDQSSDLRSSHDVLSWSTLSTPSDECQLQYPVIKEPTSARVPDAASGSELVSGNVSFTSVGSMPSGTTPTSARSMSPPTRQVSANTSMTSSMNVASPTTYDIDLRSTDEDIDYY